MVTLAANCNQALMAAALTPTPCAAATSNRAALTVTLATFKRASATRTANVLWTCLLCKPLWWIVN